MKKLCTAFSAFVLAISVAGIVAADTPKSDGWKPTRETAANPFPADKPGQEVATPESSELFPKISQTKSEAAATNPVVNAWQPRSTAIPPRIQRTQAQHVFPARPTGQQPRVLQISQPIPPAPGVGGKPMAPMTPMGMPQEETPMSSAPHEVTNVDQVFEGEAYHGDFAEADNYWDWCKHCLWLRSSGDMPQHMPYPPVHHGYYYYLPYNYNHVMDHQQRSPMMGATSISPYDREMFEKVYADVLGDEAKRKKPIPTVKPEKVDELPQIEDLLEPAEEPPIPKAKP